MSRFYERLFGLGKVKPAVETEAGAPCLHGCSESKEEMKADSIQKISVPNNLANGAKRAMATLFRTCDAAKAIQTRDEIYYDDLEAYTSYRTYTAAGRSRRRSVGVTDLALRGNILRHMMKPEVYSRNAQYGYGESHTCTDSLQIQQEFLNIRKSPKIFGYGGSLSYDRSSGSINPFVCASPKRLSKMSVTTRARACGTTPDSAPTVSIDCAEFIAMSALSSCIKFEKNNSMLNNIKKGYGGASTKGIAQSIQKPDSCLYSPKFSSQTSIAPGDILVKGASHGLIISNLHSDDPLGIQKAVDSGDCSSIDPFEDFKFDVTQSAGRWSMGPIHTTVKTYLMTGVDTTAPPSTWEYSAPFGQLLALAREACKRHPNPIDTKGFFGANDLKLGRHKAEDPQCKYKEGECPKVLGSECADSCGLSI